MLGVALSPRPWWLRPLLIASLPCGLGFFHEVGAKLLVKLGPKVDADTTASCWSFPPPKGTRPKDPTETNETLYCYTSIFAKKATLNCD
jgi:hypothetical protein